MSSSRASSVRSAATSTNPFNKLESDESSEDEEEVLANIEDFYQTLSTINVDELDSLMDMLQPNEFLGELAQLDEKATLDMFDEIIKPDRVEVKKPNYQRPEVQPAATVRGVRSATRYNWRSALRFKGSYLFLKDGKVFVTNGTLFSEVGVTALDHGVIEFTPSDVLSRAQSLSENSNTKGTGLMFSSLVHSMAILMIAGSEGIVEPVDGHDLDYKGFSFEFTGVNYYKRDTNASITINKYALLDVLLDESPLLDEFVKASICEDAADPSYFWGGSIDQGPSPYTSVMRDTMRALELMTESNMLNLANMSKHFYSKLPVSEKPPPPAPLNSFELELAIDVASKPRLGRKMAPAPFRTFSSTTEPPEGFDRVAYEVRPFIDTPDGHPTSFHTMPSDYDPEEVVTKRVEADVKCPIPERHAYNRWLFETLINFAAFNACYVESELLSKINGREGHFYSDYIKVGVSWRQIRNNSLTYWVSYYSFEDPGVYCGLWHHVKTGLCHWQSPTFKASLADIQYATILPWRILTMVAACVPYTEDKERHKIIGKFMSLTAILRGSTWQTSALSGDMRFMVLCSISKSGDVQAMLDSCAKKVVKYCSSSDFLFLKFMVKVVDRHNSDVELTPLLGLPVRFINLEKDLALFTMWKMRKISDVAAVFAKLAKSEVEEQRERDVVLEFYHKQLDYLNKTNLGLLRQHHFQDLIMSKPSCPCMNILLFIGLAYISCHNTNFGDRQKQVNIKLSTLLTDHHMIDLDERIDKRHWLAKSEYVGTLMTKTFDDYNNPESFHHLLINLNEGPKFTFFNAIHDKGSKSKRREIPMMTPRTRIVQCAVENPVGIYVDQEEVDNMTKPDKFMNFANDVSEILQKQGISSSEDKESFCKYMHPEPMSLCVYVVGRLIGATSLITAASLLSCNTSRWTMMPPDSLPDIIKEVKEKTTMRTVVRGKLVATYATKNYYYMQQGQHAMVAAMINTVFTKGMDAIQIDQNKDIEKTVKMTTSDDANRSACVKKDCVYDAESSLYDYILTPMRIMPQCLMKNSDEKWILSRVLGEFNNATVGPNGMLVTSGSHAHLTIQPLLGDNPLDDLINVVSNARATIIWGDSPDLARSAYHCNQMLFRQKWLFTDQQVEYLHDLGLLPTSDEELIEGFQIRTYDLARKLVMLMDPEDRLMAMKGEIDVHSVLRRFRVRDSKKKKTTFIKYKSNVPEVSDKVIRINSSRKVKGRMFASIVRPLNVSKRIAVRDHFMDMLLSRTEDPTDVEEQFCKRLVSNFKVVILPQIPTKRHMKPIKQGETTVWERSVDINKVKAWRFSKTLVERQLTESELEMSQLPEDEYKVRLFNMQLDERHLGLSFDSPTGAPLMRVHNEKLLVQPHAFTFKVDLPSTEPKIQNFHLMGEDYKKFNPNWLSGATLDSVKRNDAIIAIGYATKGDMNHIFYGEWRGELRRVIQPVSKKYFELISVPGRKRPVMISYKRDSSPIDPAAIGVNLQPWPNNFLSGDSVAILNYGNFINTNSNSAVRARKEIYRHFKSVYREFETRFRPNYPFYPKGAQTFNMAEVNRMEGSKNVNMLRLKVVPHPIEAQRVLLDGSVINVSTDIKVIHQFTPMDDEEDTSDVDL